MRVMQFGFMEQQDNMHLPHNYQKLRGVHRHARQQHGARLAVGGAPARARARALEYCGFPGGDWAVGGSDSASCRAMIRTLWQSPANTAIVPVQDLCGFGKDTKMNVPGSAERQLGVPALRGPDERHRPRLAEKAQSDLLQGEIKDGRKGRRSFLRRLRRCKGAFSPRRPLGARPTGFASGSGWGSCRRPF